MALTFDAGGLIALERNNRRILVLLHELRERRQRVVVPATALAQVLRSPSRQVRLSRLIRDAGTDLVPLNGMDASAVGLLLAKTRTIDIVDAHVVICAQRANSPVVTSDPNDLRKLDATIRLIEA